MMEFYGLLYLDFIPPEKQIGWIQLGCEKSSIVVKVKFKMFLEDFR